MKANNPDDDTFCETRPSRWRRRTSTLVVSPPQARWIPATGSAPGRGRAAGGSRSAGSTAYRCGARSLRPVVLRATGRPPGHGSWGLPGRGPTRRDIGGSPTRTTLRARTSLVRSPEARHTLSTKSDRGRFPVRAGHSRVPGPFSQESALRNRTDRAPRRDVIALRPLTSADAPAIRRICGGAADVTFLGRPPHDRQRKPKSTRLGPGGGAVNSPFEGAPLLSRCRRRLDERSEYRARKRGTGFRITAVRVAEWHR